MRKIIFLFLLLCVVFLFYIYLKNIANERVQPSVIQPTSTPSVYEEKTMKSSFVIIDNPSNIKLFSNISEKSTTLEIQNTKKCRILVNGGFYTEENRHIGLFQTDEVTTLNNFLVHNLFNGVFRIKDNDGFITKKSIEESRIALQAGPILVENGLEKNLSLVRDENARRIVVAVTNNNKVIFMVFYGGQSLISGPLLKDLPSLVLELSQKENLQVKDALNLDGGSHSAFITSEVQLTEIQPMGSYFCVI